MLRCGSSNDEEIKAAGAATSGYLWRGLEGLWIAGAGIVRR
jgi:hypothetical protein